MSPKPASTAFKLASWGAATALMAGWMWYDKQKQSSFSAEELSEWNDAAKAKKKETEEAPK